jgi:outer membrane protein assembly factor BamD (BamD/ComL family)
MSAAQVSADDDPESTLAQENAIYAGALARARAGDVNRALVDLEALQRDFPRSPLVQNARVEHFRLLHESGNKARAAREARRYLSDYPNGFARAEARRIALVDLEDAE